MIPDEVADIVADIAADLLADLLADLIAHLTVNLTALGMAHGSSTVPPQLRLLFATRPAAFPASFALAGLR